MRFCSAGRAESVRPLKVLAAGDFLALATGVYMIWAERCRAARTDLDMGKAEALAAGGTADKTIAAPCRGTQAAGVLVCGADNLAAARAAEATALTDER